MEGNEIKEKREKNFKSIFFDEKGKTVYIAREWQIIITIIFIGILVLAWIDGASFEYSFNQKDQANSILNYLNGYGFSEVRDFSSTFAVNDYLTPIVIALEYVIFAITMFFIWKDQPKKAFSCSFLYLIYPILFITNVGESTLENYSTKGEIWFLGYLFIVLAVILPISTFVMSRKAIDGPRPPKKVSVISEASPAINITQSPADELIKLKTLLDSGIITQDEYDLKREELVKKI